jgi:hypothetical protein
MIETATARDRAKGVGSDFGWVGNLEERREGGT